MAEPGVRGYVAVAALFLITLAGAGVDSFVATGLGAITMLVLTAATLAAALRVRHFDLVSVLAAPPLVFVAVATANITLATSFSLTGLATLLVAGFPAMAIATAAGLAVALMRRITGR